jgi:hypothetical protein
MPCKITYFWNLQIWTKLSDSPSKTSSSQVSPCHMITTEKYGSDPPSRTRFKDPIFLGFQHSWPTLRKHDPRAVSSSILLWARPSLIQHATVRNKNNVMWSLPWASHSWGPSHSCGQGIWIQTLHGEQHGHFLEFQYLKNSQLAICSQLEVLQIDLLVL